MFSFKQRNLWLALEWKDIYRVQIYSEEPSECVRTCGWVVLVFAMCVVLTCDLKGCVWVFLCNIRGLQRWGTGWVKQSSGGVKRNNAGAPGPCVQGHLAWDAPALCNLHLCGVTSKSRCFWERLGQMAIISFLSSASIWCLSIPPRNIQWGRAPTCIKTKYERGHTNVNTKANRKRCDISSILENGYNQITYSSFTASCSRIDGT